MKAKTFNKAQELVKKLYELKDQKERIESIRSHALAVKDDNGCGVVLLGREHEGVAQIVKDLILNDLTRKIEAVEKEFTDLQDEPDQPIGPIPCR